MAEKRIEITEDQLLDFIRCPVRYDSIYNAKFIPQGQPSLSFYLKKIENAFFAMLMDGQAPSMDFLKRRWDQICEENPDYLTPQKCIEGIGQIAKLYRWAERQELMIADMNSMYRLEFRSGSLLVILSGRMGTVAFSKKREPYLLEIDFSNRMPIQPMMDMKLIYTIHCKAAFEMYGKKFGIKMHYVKLNKDLYTMRNESDFGRLAATVINVAKSRELGLYYPRESVFCTTCDMLNFCKVWRATYA